MVAMLNKLNDERTLADRVHVEADGEYYPAIADKETVINHYVKLGYADSPKARKIYGDLISQKYGYIQEVTRYDGRRVDVTAAGGDLVKTWHRVQTGLFKEYIGSNYKVSTVIIAFISGVLSVVIPVIIYLLSKPQ